jgi:para-aminobenzoate synthetase component 1
MPLHYQKLNGFSSITDTFTSLFGNLPNCFWLDRETHPSSRFSVLGSGIPTNRASAKAVIEPQLDLPFDFRPHLLGVLHYQEELDTELEGDFLSVDRAVVFDHDNRVMYFLGRFDSRAEFDNWYHAALLRMAIIGGEGLNYLSAHDAASSFELIAKTSKSSYLEKIALAQEHISSGDVYQLCLTTRLEGDYSGDPLAYFLRLKKNNPAPYSSFIKIGNLSYVSISPERFLTVSNNSVISSPIKGTRPRSTDSEKDQALKLELATNPKERAENLMIVDLIRNDLSIVCKPESICVSGLFQVQSYSSVHQLVSDVSGELIEGASGFDALSALFPGGSMTGAPKLKAIELISELEDSPRAGYSGGIGWIGQDGTMDLGMVIRTAVFSNSRVSIGIGGGITSDSVPQSEHEEIQLKAQALASALGAQLRW